MNEALRWDKGLGNSAIYSRITNSSNQFYNFSTQAFVATEVTACKSFMTEYADSSPTQSWYLTTFVPPSGGPYNIDIVLVSDSSVIGNDIITTGATDPDEGSTLADLLHDILGRLSRIGREPQMDIFGSANHIIDIIYRRLMTRKSEFIVRQLVQPVNANASAVTLPSDFGGFFERPYVSGRNWCLNPLPADARSLLTIAGDPRYYELRGFTMTLFPSPAENVTIVGQYYMRPQKISAVTDTIPFSGYFDLIIQEGIVQCGDKGLAVLVDQVFLGMLYKQVDEVLSFRAPRQVSFVQVRDPGQRGYRGGHPNYFEV